jgi:hypothetical protein
LNVRQIGSGGSKPVILNQNFVSLVLSARVRRSALAGRFRHRVKRRYRRV